MLGDEEVLRWVTMKYHDEFEWDPAKAKANQKKDGITFELAEAALADEQAEIFHYEEYDDAHSMEEDRHTTLASHPSRRSVVLKVTWTDRSVKGKRIPRIVSARLATRGERKLYEKVIAKHK
jgi:uncharacterized protein